MAGEEDSGKLLTHDEVRKILEKSLKRPLSIYDGPEEAVPKTVVIDDGPAPEGGELSEPPVQDPMDKVSFEKRATLDHVRNFTRIDSKKAQALIKELLKIERVTEPHALKIAELMPRDETELRIVFAKERYTIEPEELKKMLDVIDAHR